jgi:hypothetical protein
VLELDDATDPIAAARRDAAEAAEAALPHQRRRRLDGRRSRLLVRALHNPPAARVRSGGRSMSGFQTTTTPSTRSGSTGRPSKGPGLTCPLPGRTGVTSPGRSSVRTDYRRRQVARAQAEVDRLTAYAAVREAFQDAPPWELGFALTLVDGRKDLAVFATVVASVFAPVTA